MDLELTDDQLELRATIHSVLARESPIALARALTEATTDTEPLWATMVELGWPALTVPEAFGGIGLGAVEAAVLCEELGMVVAATPLLPTITQFVPMVLACGNEQQQQLWLSAVAAGDCRATLGIAESTGSFDPNHTAATAQRSNDGSTYTLSGTKRFVLEADHCDVIAVTVRVDDGIAFAIIDAAACAVTRTETLDATRSYCDVELAGIVLPADRICIPTDTTAIRDVIEYATLALALETVGVCSSIFDITLEYAKQREQFGVPIGSFQSMKHKFADLVVLLERARALGYFAALCIAERDERRHLAIAAAKAAAGDAQKACSKEGIQIHGGIGYTWEHDMHLYIRRAKSNDQLFGTAAMQRAEIANLLNV